MAKLLEFYGFSEVISVTSLYYFTKWKNFAYQLHTYTISITSLTCSPYVKQVSG